MNASKLAREKQAARLKQVQADVQLSDCEDHVQQWLDGKLASPNYVNIDDVLPDGDLSDEALRLRCRARALELRIVYKGMSTQHLFTTHARAALSYQCFRNEQMLPALDNPEKAYAFLSCLFNEVSFGLSARDSRRATTFLHKWLPTTVKSKLKEGSTCQDLANMIFDPNWLTIYDIDFNSLSDEQLDTVLLTHPPLNGEVLTTNLATSPEQVALPTIDIESMTQ